MYNSLKYAKILENAGFSREQAEVQVQMITEIIEANLATKQDIKDLENKITLSEHRLTIKLGTIVSIAIGIAAAVAKFA
jgi:hypothetical protein